MVVVLNIKHNFFAQATEKLFIANDCALFEFFLRI